MHFVSDLCGIYMLGVGKSCLLYGVHAVCMLHVCMWVFVWCLHAQMLPVCICCMMYVCVVRVYRLCRFVYLVHVYHVHIVYVVCALSCEPHDQHVCAVAESRTLLGQSRHHAIPKSPGQNF